MDAGREGKDVFKNDASIEVGKDMLYLKCLWDIPMKIFNKSLNIQKLPGGR